MAPVLSVCLFIIGGLFNMELKVEYNYKFTPKPKDEIKGIAPDIFDILCNFDKSSLPEDEFKRALEYFMDYSGNYNELGGLLKEGDSLPTKVTVEIDKDKYLSLKQRSLEEKRNDLQEKRDDIERQIMEIERQRESLERG